MPDSKLSVPLSRQVNGATAEATPVGRVHFPALDGLRGIAFLAVFLYHYGLFTFGWTGVDLFFVLSGFLITGILYDTIDKPHRVRTFYARRSLRIFPLYYGVFFIILLTAPFARWHVGLRWILWPIYLANWLVMFHRGSFDAATTAVMSGFLEWRHGPALYLGHFWSLCVEEQFYLLWPWIVFYVRRRGALLKVCGAVILITPLLRLAAFYTFSSTQVAAEAVAHNTVFRIDTLMFGAGAALLYRGSHREALISAARPLAWLAGVLGVGLLILMPQVPNHSHTMRLIQILGYSVIALLSTAVILRALTTASRLYNPLIFGPLRWVGKISYGAYVFHDIFHSYYARVGHGSKLLTAAAGLLSTMALAALSYRFFETPFLRLKDRTGPQ